MKKILLTVVIVFVLSLGILAFSFHSVLDEDVWLKVIQVSITASGFAGALHSLNIAIDRAKRNKSVEGVSLFEKFIDDSMTDVRKTAWRVKLKWDNETGYKERILMLYSVENRQNNEEEKKELYEFLNVIQLMAFYDMLSLHEQHKKEIVRLKYFYFDWWRKFLYDVANELDNRRVNVSGFPKGYLENTKYTTSIERLDRMLGLHTFPKNKEMIIHKKPMAPEEGSVSKKIQ
ncbi:hypothetical protein [Flagellimonas flava]|uniref:hypothetical protein n=1 Tax=Flagellimonas flava TaxID=570519 RepID=UPI003D65FE03